MLYWISQQIYGVKQVMVGSNKMYFIDLILEPAASGNLFNFQIVYWVLYMCDNLIDSNLLWTAYGWWNNLAIVDNNWQNLANTDRSEI